MAEIIVAVLQSNGHQVYRNAFCCILLHGLYGSMETTQANKLLRRDADIGAEDTQELAFAQTGDRCHFGSGDIAFGFIAGCNYLT